MSAEACRTCAGEFSDPPRRIAELATSTLSLAEDQFFPGWCLLVLKRHATELWQLAPAERQTLMEEVTRVAQALAAHWHLIPRRADDPSPTMPVWTVEHAPKRLSPAEIAERVARIRAQLNA